MTPLPEHYNEALYGKIVGHAINSGHSVADAHAIADRAVTDQAQKAELAHQVINQVIEARKQASNASQ